MHELHELIDKLRQDALHLSLLEQQAISPESILIALSIAKRARRTSTLLTRQLAAIRDEQLQP